MSDDPAEPPRRSIVETFDELAELTRGVDWDAFVAEREAERRMPADLAEALALLREARAEFVDDDEDLAVRIDALQARHPAPDSSPEDRP